MEKRITLTIALCLLVYLVWLSIQGAPRPEPPTQPPDPAAAERPAATAPAPAAAAGAPAPAAARPPLRSVQPVEPEQTFQIDTDAYRCVLTSRGAAILSWRLKGFYTRADLSAAEKELEANWWPVLDEFEAGRRSLAVALHKGDLDLADAVWTCLEPPAAQGDVVRAVFGYALPDGVRVVKTFRFHRTLSTVDMTLGLVRPSEEVEDSYTFEVCGPAGVKRESAEFFATLCAVDQGPLSSPLAYEVKHHAAGDGWQRKTYDHEPLRYVAVIDRYFLALLTLPPTQRGVYQRKSAFTGVLTDQRGLAATARRKGVALEKLLPQFQLLQAGALYEVAFAAGSRETALAFTLYAGPSRAAELEAANLGALTGVLGVSGYSMCGLDWLVVPVSEACKFLLRIFYALVHNYGIAILLLTLVVRLLMFPLTRKQMVSMHTYQQKIGKLKPELDRINQKYKTNPKKKQQEVMKLYKEHHVSVFPMMGCLPLLVNIPVFFGLFHALRSTMDLRHAPFLLWIKDLSAPDALVTFAQPISLVCVPIEALNILPIIMGITWFAQMYFAPRPADPQAAQTQKMMMFMPVMFMFMLYNYAAGLSLYWTFNSVLALIEQRLIKRSPHFRSPAAAGAAPGRK
ncbi:MAG: membrane protein insertase YidC [Planctomycetes bacterium]|nr:membrane protein insertase YidC [Planctomycetota bacterium]